MSSRLFPTVIEEELLIASQDVGHRAGMACAP